MDVDVGKAMREDVEGEGEGLKEEEEKGEGEGEGEGEGGSSSTPEGRKRGSNKQTTKQTATGILYLTVKVTTTINKTTSVQMP